MPRGLDAGPSYDEYTFLYHFPMATARVNGTRLAAPPSRCHADRLRTSLMPVASVTAHEFFHLWNVKAHPSAVARTVVISAKMILVLYV